MSIDPATGLSAAVGYSGLGIFEDLAFRPAPPPGSQTTVVGRLVDNLGAPVESALVTVRNLVWSESGADGRFTLTGVPVSFGDIVVVVPPGPVSSRQSESDPTPPIAGGTTDVGDIEVEAGVVALVAGKNAALVPTPVQPLAAKPPEGTSSVARPQPSPAPAAMEKRTGGGGGSS